MKLYLIRHGQTEWNAKGLWQGQSDIFLNEAGMNQAIAVAKRFVGKQEAIGRVYTSPLARAFRTAETVNGFLGKEMIARDDLKEIYLGGWEGKTVLEITDGYPDIFQKWEYEENPALDFDVETYDRLQARAYAAVCDIITAEGTGKDLVIVSHGAWIKALLCKVLGIRLADRMKLVIENAAITTLLYSTQDGFRVLTVNDIAHLD